MNVFGPAPSQEQILAKRVDAQLQAAAIAVELAYREIRRAIYANPAFPDPNAAYAAFVANTRTGFGAQDLGNAARAAKALVNQFAPGRIVDEVPEAVVSFDAQQAG